MDCATARCASGRAFIGRGRTARRGPIRGHAGLARAAVALGWLGLSLTGCAPSVLLPPGLDPQPQGASLCIRIGAADADARTLLPEIDMRPASYEVGGSGPAGARFSLSTAETVVEVSELEPGEWTVTVEALNAGGGRIGRGLAAANLVDGEAQTVSVPISPLDGTGALQLAVSWAAADVPAPSVVGQLTEPGGSAVPIIFSLDPASATATADRAAVPAGYYALEVRLLDGGSAVRGAAEVVRIVDGWTTAGAFDLSGTGPAGSPKGSPAAAGTLPGLDDPLIVTLAGAVEEIAAGGSMALTASAGAEAGETAFRWYLDGGLQATGSGYAAGEGLAAGWHRVDVCAFGASGRRAGSAGYLFQVTEAAPQAASCTLEWNPNSEPELAGYKLYYGTASRTYEAFIDAGNRTSCTVTGLDPQLVYYFAATAYDAEGVESGYSNEVSWSAAGSLP